MSKDPIGARIDRNVYAFAHNAATTHFDALGLSSWCCDHECWPGAKECRIALAVKRTAPDATNVLKDIWGRLETVDNVDMAFGLLGAWVNAEEGSRIVELCGELLSRKTEDKSREGPKDAILAALADFIRNTDDELVTVFVHVDRRRCTWQTCLPWFIFHHFAWEDWKVTTGWRGSEWTPMYTTHNPTTNQDEPTRRPYPTDWTPEELANALGDAADKYCD